MPHDYRNVKNNFSNKSPNNSYKGPGNTQLPDEFKEFEITDFFEGEILKKELINNIGNHNVAELAKLLADRKVTINQIRKHYDSFLSIYNTRLTEEQKKIKLIMLKANVTYNANRNKQFILGKFIDNRFNIIIKKDNTLFNKYLDAFKLQFEALVGYFPKK